MESTIENEKSVFADEPIEGEYLVRHTCPVCEQETEIRDVTLPIILDSIDTPDYHSCDKCDRIYTFCMEDDTIDNVSSKVVRGSTRYPRKSRQYYYNEDYAEQTFEQLLSEKNKKYNEEITNEHSFYEMITKTGMLQKVCLLAFALQAVIIPFFAVCFAVYLPTRISIVATVLLISGVIFAAAYLRYSGWILYSEKHTGVYIEALADSDTVDAKHEKMFLSLVRWYNPI